MGSQVGACWLCALAVDVVDPRGEVDGSTSGDGIGCKGQRREDGRGGGAAAEDVDEERGDTETTDAATSRAGMIP